MRHPRERRLLGVFGTLIVATLLVVVILPATAVNTLGLVELDRNLVDGSAGDPRDWAVMFDSDGDPTANLPAGTVDTSFVKDFTAGSNSDSTYHEPSNKDDQAISSTGGSEVWGCTTVANATDKNDIVNAYAVSVVKTISGSPHQIIYFGVERFDNSGDAFLGVWFFQDLVACDPDLGKFTGSKTTGDVLLLVNFTGGGSNAVVSAFEYTEGATETSPGTLTPAGTTTFDCTSPTLPSDHTFCATTNTDGVSPPWPMVDKKKPGGPSANPDDTHEPFQFFEGGIDLTDTFDLAEPICIQSLLAETRSSSSTDATLKDFAGGDFNTCGGIRATKYFDKNADGSRDADGPDNDLATTGDNEGPLSGWIIFIDAGAQNGTLDNEDANCNGVEDGSENWAGSEPVGEICGITDSNGDVVFSNLAAGTYRVCEVLQASWTNTDPGGTDLCEEGVSVGGGGGETTVDFGNTVLHKIIVLICHESSNTLVSATNDLTMTIGGTTVNRTSLPPGGGGSITDAQLCSLGTSANQFTGLPHGAQSVSVNVPSSGTNSGH